MNDDAFSALAALYLEPQYQAMAESPHATLDLLPLLKAVEAAERARCVCWCGLGSSDGYAEHHISVGTPVPAGPNVKWTNRFH